MVTIFLFITKVNLTKVSKVHIFWEGHKIMRNLPLTFDYSTTVKSKGNISQNYKRPIFFTRFISNGPTNLFYYVFIIQNKCCTWKIEKATFDFQLYLFIRHWSAMAWVIMDLQYSFDLHRQVFCFEEQMFKEISKTCSFSYFHF